MREKGKSVVKVKINGINSTLRISWRANEIKLGYQINSCRLAFENHVGWDLVSVCNNVTCERV